MTLRSYIWGIRSVTLLSFVVFVSVIYFVDPDSSGLAGKLLFYVSLFFVFSGVFNLFLLALRRRSFINEETTFTSISLSFRQGFLLSCFAVGLLILQSFRMLIWWDGLLLLAGIFMVEIYFASKGD